MFNISFVNSNCGARRLILERLSCGVEMWWWEMGKKLQD
jgi:hypothetical protein